VISILQHVLSAAGAHCDISLEISLTLQLKTSQQESSIFVHYFLFFLSKIDMPFYFLQQDVSSF
jgi:hypothetical protein